ncbi:6556_t:CDS:2 [Diversispora eburnea]|uniref:6556_t:CDS:1 n=1 Tax=Diversispora eburnea TaxID=1213867 RepID=A0A9N8YQ45_9GLOM|nr:6556_t:CDS:2 [Diversispora eburnea]
MPEFSTMDIVQSRNAKVTILGSVAAPGINSWVISLDANLKMEFEVSAGRMKYVGVTNNNLNNENDNVPEESIISEPETSIPNDSEQDEEEINKLHNAFNENLVKAITPGSFLFIDESMCQWMVEIDKGPFQQKIPRKPHPIGCEFKLHGSIAEEQLLQIHDALESVYGSFVSRTGKFR